MMPEDMVEKMGDKSIRELAHLPFFNVSKEEIDKTDEIICKIKIDISNI